MNDKLLERISALDPARRRALLGLLRGRSDVASPQERPQARGARRAPVSFAQGRLLFANELEPRSPRYNVPECLRVRGALDVEALRRALDVIVGRHEILRTRFVRDAEGFVQCIEPPFRVAVTLEDFSSVAPEGREQAVRQWLEEQSAQASTLDELPLFRVLLARIARDDHVLLLLFHHVVYDGWSRGILLRELIEAYEETRRGGTPVDTPHAAQYADYAIGQRSPGVAAAYEALLERWVAALEGCPLTSSLPVASTSRAHQRTWRAAETSIKLAPDTSRRLAKLLGAEQCTPFMGALALTAAGLARFLRQDDLVLGAPFANRERSDLQGVIGFFVNVLPVRLTVDGDGTFRDLLRRTRARILEASAMAEVPFEAIVERVRPPRLPGCNPIFQVSVSAGDDLDDLPRLGDATLEPFECAWPNAIFDLSVFLERKGGDLGARFVYARDRIGERLALAFASAWACLASGACMQPDVPLSRLSTVGPEERAELVARGRGSPVILDERPLTRVIEDIAAATPERVALTDGDIQMTYGELVARASALGGELAAQGVGRGDHVGVCVPRSAALVIGMLGAWYAGAAYVPLDPAHPDERIGFVLRDAGVRVVVTSEELSSRFAPFGVRPVVGSGSTERGAIPKGLSSRDRAYVIYTSGTTGNPKGVAISHGNVQALYAGARQSFDFREDDVWTLFHSHAFDFSVWEMCGALLHGGRLVIVPEATARSAGAYLELIASERVTVVNQTPTAFRALVDADLRRPESGLSSVRCIMLGGEAIDLRVLRAWSSARPNARTRFMTLYGPTEATVLVTMGEIEHERDSEGGAPLGRPIGGAGVHLLDAYGEPVPDGAVGEICLGGPGVASGYLHRPDLDAARFSYARLGGAAPERLYRTGDLARFDDRGELEYLGRLDDQVKIRGYRIELGEVEAAMESLPFVRQACVVVDRRSAGGARLVAFVCVAGAADLGAPEDVGARFMAELRQRLPSAMVPAAFALVDELPRNTSGKVDRSALQARAPTVRASGRDCTGPRTETERRMLAIWRGVLGVDSLGVRDDFFDLGGHSLLAVTLMHRLREELGVTLPVSALFEAPCIEALALRVECAGHEPSQGGPLVLLHRGSATPQLFLLHPSGGRAAAYAELVREARPAMRVYGVESRACTTGERELEAMQDMARAYAAAITARAAGGGPILLGGWSFGGVLSTLVADELGRAAVPVRHLFLFDALTLPAGVTYTPSALDELASLCGASLTHDLLEHAPRLERDLAEALRGVPAPERRARMLGWARARRLLVTSLPDDVLLREMDLVDHHARLLVGVSPPRIDVPITVFWAGERRPGAVPRTAWSEVTTGPVEEVVVAGNHFSMLREPHVGPLARELARRLDAATSPALASRL
ncbi:amino acid adenylation domain-containing protein [Polyangium sp. y55x31]|uniref:non-ribosomal peptide synthetase n=1 Tax=Polyangium sp. y55x31 TaxID=3042688 RepID=UPI0024822630|nr:amino acid adenylation domain-containing protein [Polyangium sp. y55x31]MDI1480355.1 amino acid adenylation domain-containing protein [Polyangium sp. y55x31]